MALDCPARTSKRLRGSRALFIDPTDRPKEVIKQAASKVIENGDDNSKRLFRFFLKEYVSDCEDGG